MKLAFLIDKPQTVQMIAALLCLGYEKGYDISVYATCGEKQIQELKINVRWCHYTNRTALIKDFLQEKNKYDKIFGLNMFNDVWAELYQKNSENTYALEYCWNELYNCHRQNFQSKTKLLTNTEWSRKQIYNNSTHKEIYFLGSPWYEFIKKFSISEEDKKPYVVFMAPHTSYFMQKTMGGFVEHVNKFLLALNAFKQESKFDVILKTRQKYGDRMININFFDDVVSDINAFDHLKLYSEARAVFHFCSSGVSELCLLRTPSFCIFPSYQNRLNYYDPEGAIKREINKRYYGGNIIDNTHCFSLDVDNYNDLYRDTGYYLKQLQAPKNWQVFQDKFFSKGHDNASEKILQFIQK